MIMQGSAIRVLILAGLAMTIAVLSSEAQAQPSEEQGQQLQIVLNGETSRLEQGISVSDLVESLGREPGGVDVQYNGRFLHRSEYDDVVLQDGDRVEIVDRDDQVDQDRYALALAFGLVNTDEGSSSGDVEPYYGLSFRIGFGRDDHDDWSNRSTSNRWNGYLEPELGYWEASDEFFATTDLLIGVNLVGVTEVGVADFFIGGGIGLHFVDQDLTTIEGEPFSTSDEAIGVNAQFGVDLNMSDNTALFFVGRFDIIEDRDAVEGKAYVGIRFGS
jgi:thiamine biosynthesis protein ThiS